MLSANKWHTKQSYSFEQPALSCDNALPSLDIHSSRAADRTSSASQDRKSFSSYSESKRTHKAALRDSIISLLQIDMPDNLLLDCPDDILDIVWSLVSDNQRRSQMLKQVTERIAVTSNENKLLKQAVSRLNNELERSRNNMESLKKEFERKEEILNAKMEELGRSRAEWEKAALTFKGREKSFFAEIRKRDQEVDRVKRTMSIGRNSYVDERLLSPPPLGVGNRGITRLNYG
jgi:hypothetical protein